MGRRVQKTVYAYAASTFNLQPTHLYTYNGWNLVKETTIPDSGSAVDKYYVWGLDLSQSLQGAGGVGGLLAVVDGSLTYQYLYDANGNVGQLIDAGDGSVVAHYEYDPFGNLVNQSGDYADENPYRFSTKYHDAETNLYYYGYRYYSPMLGRWLNRDPIEEDGGKNLFEFVDNSPNNIFDLLGQDFIAIGVRPLNMDPLDREHGRYIFANHTSIEYWESACPAKEGKEHWSRTFEKNGAKSTDSFELIADLDHKWYKRSNRGNLEKVRVSIVTYKTSNANRFSAFYEPKLPNKNQVRNMWKSLKTLAESYPYAEQTKNNKFNGNFKNWPNSYYQLFGNNCHTFSRWIIDKSGKPVPNVWGTLPGNDSPMDVILPYNRNGKPPFPK